MRRRSLAPFLLALLAGCASPGDGDPTPPPAGERCPTCLRPFGEGDAAALRRASVEGKYGGLLRILEAPADRENYGEFRDWGHWSGTAYRGYGDLPAGWWVYVHPNWYVWERQEPGGGPP